MATLYDPPESHGTPTEPQQTPVPIPTLLAGAVGLLLLCWLALSGLMEVL